MRRQGGHQASSTFLTKSNISAKFFKLSYWAESFRPYYFIFLVFIAFVTAYHLFFYKRIIPGVTVAGINLGGKTYDQAVQTLQSYESGLNKDVVLYYKDNTYTMTSDSIDLKYNWDATVSRSFEVGRTGNIFVDTRDKVAGVFKRIYIAAFYDYDNTHFNNFLSVVEADVNVPAKNSFFEIKDKVKKELGITKEVYGYVVDDEDLISFIIKSFDDVRFTKKEIITDDNNPKITADALDPHLVDAQKVVFSPLKIKYQKLEWPMTPEQKLDLLEYDPIEKVLEVNKAAFRTYIEGISSKINRPPRGVVTETEDHKVATFELIQDGVEIDMDLTNEAFRQAYFAYDPVTEVKVKEIKGPLDARKYGILALIGEGKSKFTGSAQGRINNLTLAAKRASGVLVPPGAIFSFNESVGEISGATGYDSALIILGNATVLGSGGGVCQTSTTLFRAVLNSGLPVITRHPHAYRVRYYEIESPTGIDASVFQPSLDFQFKNDTENYILIQSSADLENSQLTFKIYGTPDGREVKLSEPVIASQTPPPAPEYRDDPTLAKGVVRQIDYSAWGASVSFTRKVTRGDEILYNDIFKTNYQPWKAVFLVGTKE